MKIRIKYYASLRELVGTPSEELNLEDGSKIEDLMRKIMEIHKPLKEVKRILIAVNEDYVEMNENLRDGDLVALFPPVSGG
ncbi:MAG: molybdopterin converting factor subunit 1 [Candidatus Bathyarchaeia archaeon]|nr:molybdopterin converting factor subunit 1 [Candidatus Bathyarchaeota archaeon]